MTLQPLRLDDLTWEEMTAAIRRRIPAESDGAWTLHAPVDPGITLLELFAGLLEQRQYWLDQVPDAVVVGVLGLLGLDPPGRARPAGTVLELEHGAGGVVAAGTAFARDEQGQLAFTTDAAVRLLQVASRRLLVDRQDRTADLEAGRGVALLPADGEPGEARVELVMPAPVAGRAGERLSLLLELETPDSIPPAWHPAAVPGVPPPASTTWLHALDDREPIEFAKADVEDGTQGLRRSGIVRLRIPDAWRAGGAPARRHAVVVRTGRGTFSAPPRLRRLTVNVAAARHSRRVRPSDDERVRLERHLLERPPLPGLHLDLPGAPGGLLGARLRLRERDGRWHAWTATDDLAFHGPGDRVFLLDRAAGSLRFGDGRTGRIPVPVPVAPADHDATSQPLLRVRWDLGGGLAGNGGTSRGNWHALDGPPVTASNPVAADGGLDPETIEQVRRRAAAALRERHRAVTREDYEVVARETSGVAVQRAHAAVGEHPGFPCAKVPGAVSVYVVPHAPRHDDDWDRPDFVAAPRPDPGMRQRVCERLGAARLLAAEVFLRELRYRSARLRVDLTGAPTDPAAARRRVQARLRTFLDPLVGGDDGDGWPFGEPLRPSALLRVAREAAGGQGEVAAVAVRLDGEDRWEDCRDVPIGPQELVTLQEVRVRFRPVATPSEGLQ